MGIRFQCHVCEKQLNIKQDLAGKRGKCPACSARFRIPLTDSPQSIPIDGDDDGDGRAASAAAPATGTVRKVTPVTTPPPQDNLVADDATAADWEETGDAETDDAETDDAETDDAVWYVRPPSGGQYGPASTAVLHQWIDEGRVAATALVWRDGWPQWRSASEAMPQLASQLPHTGAVVSSGTKTPTGTKTPNGTGTAVSKPVADAKDSSSSGLGSASASLSGSAAVGSQRRARSTRRILWIGLLAAVALVLIAVLVMVVNR